MNYVTADGVALNPEYQYLLDGDVGHAGDVAGMISREERVMLRQLGGQYRGHGAVVDAGSFCGASTVALAQGVTDRGYRSQADGQARQAIIHAYEYGSLPAPANPSVSRLRNYNGFEYQLGESFVPVLQSNIRPYASMIDLHIGDVLEENWTFGPIEVCFLDLCKTIAIDDHVTRLFFPHFVPHTTILVQQDYFFHRLPWIKTTLGFLAPHLEWLGRVRWSSIYRVKEPPSADLFAGNIFLDHELDSLVRFHDSYMTDALDDRVKFQMDVSKAYLMALKRETTQSLDFLEHVSGEYVSVIQQWDADTDNAEAAGGAPGAVMSASGIIEQARRQINSGRLHAIS